MRCISLLLLLIAALGLQAQDRCAATAFQAGMLADIPPSVSIQPYNEAHRFEAVDNNKVSLIRIPVVVHVLYQDAAQQISDAQIISGIEAMNRDFRRRNADTVHTPTHFRHLAADMQIEFVLAVTDPQGRPTKGIVRKPTAVAAWSADDKIKFSAKGGDDAWDTKSFLNIWVGNMPRALGYATAPGGNAAADGIVITTQVFATMGRKGAYDMGRTLVHEAGHWLGLKHVWGDESCGDDEVADTPRQAGFTSGCPTGVVSTCANGSNGDMYMNFMDFTNDACMNLFTTGQKERARSLFNKGGARYSMLNSIGLQAPFNYNLSETTPAVTNDPAVQATGIRLYPNPANEYVVVQAPHCAGAALQVIDLAGKVVYTGFVVGTPLRINTREWPAGLYQVVVAKGAERYVAKLVKASGK